MLVCSRVIARAYVAHRASLGGMVLIGRKRAAAKRAEPRQARETEVMERNERRRQAGYCISIKRHPPTEQQQMRW